MFTNIVILSVIVSLAAAQGQGSAPGAGGTHAGGGQHAPPAAARRDDPQVARARERYQSSQWPRGDKRAGFKLGDLNIRGFSAGAVEVLGENALARRFSPADAKPVFLIESWVFETAAEAHEKLLEHLAFVSSPGALPTAQASGYNFGDIGYIGFSGAGPGRIAWLAFARGNVVVRITNLDTKLTTQPDAAGAAAVADAAILAAPKVNDSEPLPKPKIKGLTLEKAKCAAGEIVGVRFENEGEPAVYFDWRVEGSGLGYVERTSAGGYALHTTGAGAIRLVLAATSAYGVTALASAEIQVAAR